MIEIKGRKGLMIFFDINEPEKVLSDRPLFNEKNEKVIKDIKSKPFIVGCDLKLLIYYNNKRYVFTIPKGYTWNGANVPPFAWLLIGQSTDPRFKLASCVHDYVCEHHSVIGNDRYLSTLLFETLCNYFGKFNDFKCSLMFHCVDNFQKLFGIDLLGNKWR